MEEKDLPNVSRIIKSVFNKSDAKRAMNDLLFHFKAKEVGIDDGERYWIEGLPIAGFCGLSCIRKHFALSWFAVKKSEHSKGIGKLLIKFVIKEAKKMGAKAIYVECGSLPRFKKANSLYRRLGFREKFRIRNFWNKGDDLILFSKRL